jgi:DNA-binding MarR family transcriptional regulator
MMNRRTTAEPMTAPGAATGVAPARPPRSALVRLASEALESAADAASRELDREAGEFGLSDAKLEVIEVLACCGDLRSCLCDLGERLRVTRPNVTKLIDGLERAGLVERLPHPQDGRMVQAHLTRAGNELAARALPRRAERIERIWADFEDDELEVLTLLLRRCGPA